MRLLGPKKISPDESTTRIGIGSVVEYEQHGVPMLAVVVGEKKDKWVIVNSRAAQVELPAARLYLVPGRAPESAKDNAARARFLDELNAQCEALVEKVDMEEIWNLLAQEKREIPTQEFIELAFSDPGMAEHIAVRWALLRDQIFFKRKKIGFEPRPEETVQQLKVQAEIERKRALERSTLVDALVARLKDRTVPLPKTVRILEEYAAHGKSSDSSKEALSVLEEVLTRSGLSTPGKSHDRAFHLLVAAGHFSPDQNLTLIRLGRTPEFSDAVLGEAAALAEKQPSLDGREDLRGLFTVTIDGEGTRDCDDALSIESVGDGFRIGIHIADVASLLPLDSVVMQEAFRRATSIYTADAQVPMLPPSLSENALSLLEGEERATMSFFIEMDAGYQIRSRRITRGVISVHRRMTYDEVDAMLFDEHDGTELHRLLLGLWDATCVLEERRLAAGASGFSRREMNAVVNDDGTVGLQEASEDTPAHKLVSEMMILANETAALYGRDNGLPLVYRSQEPPDCNPEEQGLDIVEGPARDFYQRSFLKRSFTGTNPGPHYGLGLPAYIQATSPIRRSADLINQQQIAEHLAAGKPLYTREEMLGLMETLEPGLDEAMLVQRERNRYFLLKYLVQEEIRRSKALIIKTDGPKPLAELDRVFLLNPFHAASDMKNLEAARKRRGEEIWVAIDSIDPRSDTLVLREVSEG